MCTVGAYHYKTVLQVALKFHIHVLLHICILLLMPLLASAKSGLLETPDRDIIEKVELVPNRHWIYKKRVDWFTAAKLCDKDERQLAIFPRKKDADAALEALYNISYFSEKYVKGKENAELGLDRNYWIGLYDFGHEGMWEWLNKRVYLSYKHFWTAGQPDHVDDNGVQLNKRHQHCVGLWNPFYHKNTAQDPIIHSFDDKECTKQLYFICQRKEVPVLAYVPAIPTEESFEYYSYEAMQESMVPEPPNGHVDQPPETANVDCEKLECHPKFYVGAGWIPNLNQDGKRQCSGGILKCRKKTKFDYDCLEKSEEFQKKNTALCLFLQIRYHNGDKSYKFS